MMMKKLLNIQGFVFSLLLILPATGKPSAAEPIYCKFENAIVPCTKLKRSIKPGGFTQVKLRYRFEKFVPLWPNQGIFGAPSPTPDFSKGEPANGEDAYYNAIIPAASPAEIIDVKPVSDGFSEGTFVDTSLAAAHGKGPVATTFQSKLVPISVVFQGSETSAQWGKAVSTGVTCKKEQAENEYGFLSRDCAFARRQRVGDQAIEYCTYSENTDSAVKGTTQCILVATETKGIRSVLATQYALHDVPAQAGGELELQCILPEQNYLGGAAIVRAALEKYVGKTSKISSRPNLAKFEAEGMKIEQADEKVFVRAFLRGRFSELPSKEDYLVLPENAVKKFPAAPMIAIQTSFTISAQASDDITDYREPNSGVGMRIRNQFAKSFVSELRKSVPKAICVNGMI
jgi:hypothetical protein